VVFYFIFRFLGAAMAREIAIELDRHYLLEEAGED
jgi:hypothetical protein